MTRYGFAIKALPKGEKPLRDDEDEDPKSEEAVAGSAAGEREADASPEVLSTGAEAELDAGSQENAVGTKPYVADPNAAEGDEATPPGNDSGAAEDAGGQATPAKDNDARPWSGDMYDEGDETDPANAFAAYTGAGGEEAWLDQAADGTLTGWVRDATGQVWRYSDPDVWAIDVDDAHMNRTHSRAQGDDGEPPTGRGGQDPLFPPQQKQS